MMTKAWLHWIGYHQQKTVDEIVDQLAKLEIKIQGFNDHRDCGNYGIVFCNEVNAAIGQQLQEISQNGQIQVLVCCCAAIPNETAWQLIQSGAADVLTCKAYHLAIPEITARLQRWQQVDQLVSSPVVQNVLIGQSHIWKAVLQQIVEVAHFTDASVLIMGESGTGKELLANLIHILDARNDKGQLVILDCSTIMPELSGSEFFGHERGAFTGAVSAREGVFSLADKGTLFLDEVGELPIALQTQLLRVIQEHTFKRVGGNAWQRTSFRLVCATNRDLWMQVQQGEFRADLYYRIASYVCKIPPLRERTEDILPLAYHFLKELRPENFPQELDPTVQEYLIQRDYPGNIRDLKQVVARMLCHHASRGAITMGCIPPDDRPSKANIFRGWLDTRIEVVLRMAMNRGVGLRSICRGIKDTAIRIALDEADGNMQCAATRLGVSVRTIQLWRAAQRQKCQKAKNQL